MVLLPDDGLDIQKVEDVADKQMKSRQVFVSGASGFVGQHLVPLLLAQGYDVVALARDESKAKNFSWYPHVKFLAFDFLNDDLPMTPEAGASLIHLAWQGLPNYDSVFHLEQNLPASYHFIKNMVNAGVGKVFVAGTCLEYGLQNGPLRASSKTEPVTSYALAKDSLRKYLGYLKKEVPFVLQWARLFYMYGAGQNKKSLLAMLDVAIQGNAPVFDMSGGEQLRDYLPVEQVASKMLQVFLSDRDACFNVCSGRPISIRRLVEQRIAEYGSSIKINLGYYPYPDYEPMAFWGVEEDGFDE